MQQRRRALSRGTVLILLALVVGASHFAVWSRYRSYTRIHPSEFWGMICFGPGTLERMVCMTPEEVDRETRAYDAYTDYVILSTPLALPGFAGESRAAAYALGVVNSALWGLIGACLILMIEHGIWNWREARRAKGQAC